MTRQRLAPSAERIATSFCRPSDRVNNRLATFAHAISSTKPTAVQDQQDWPNRSDDLFLERNDPGGYSSVRIVVLLFDATRDDIQVRRRLRWINTGF